MNGPEGNTRRHFIKNAVTGVATISLGGILPGFSAKSYASIIGANDRIRVAMMGVNARGLALADNFSQQPNCEISYVCDVDSRAADKCMAVVEKNQHKRPKAEPDFRRALEKKEVDALVVAAPDHWHAPAAILASKAGKHVYLEKPCSHNPNEGEILLAAVAKYKNVIQMGNQRRSYPNIVAAIKELHAGIIGRPYFAKTWYNNNRPSIGIGKETAVPDWLNFDLWQGPAPRVAYKDNFLHYNWHWFWHWGTGEALNNGTHMVDLARWGLGVDYPTKVTSAGGRYRYKDDWQTPDTQVMTIEFGDKATITWEGRSCNGRNIEGSNVGVIFYGESGSLQIGAGNGYTVYDLNNKLIKEVKNDVNIVAGSLTNPSQSLDALHINNFFDAIKKGTTLRSDILSGHKSTLLVQLGNIAQRSGSTLEIDPENGHILNNREAMKYWKRTYQKGWEPTV
ncbi:MULTISPECIES: Gfo/Idh/MocA family protein [Pedobacter]|uniref:Oxidoreductase domain protein n=1 Tax=Pedobacter heparinus (strain ATCC 13125 / DSM 2366 / CIP 104194 / JCM 7457 / NBRC 12017 / NCIMB 9290 / NRRL B-14731 / HIM 762-3) TaxID=485917 RepID=C6XUQ6_PEDHD|nr:MULTISPECIES: Gfo/Idh/MocA family oxidoreductase [Pedobacter]ACU03906.1 oxidoreductase domain protein [Pedobacter heparinus DSM 2366]MBB5436569.1 putative dehydrogenase [Pedobacter sp. AK017]